MLGSYAIAGSLTAEALLRSFCLHLIADAAGDVAFHAAPAEGLDPQPPPLEPWLCSLRAASVATAIRAYSVLGGGEVAVSVSELWPHLIALVCSPHSAVRAAVADFFCGGVAAAAGLEAAAVLSAYHQHPQPSHDRSNGNLHQHVGALAGRQGGSGRFPFAAAPMVKA